MPSISQTIARLRSSSVGSSERLSKSERLVPLDGFGSNPGHLRAFYYLPGDAPSRLPLVVVLHGCTQNAAGYDRGSGWSQLAKEHGFAVLYPEQQRANNPNLCFNWYEPAHNRRDAGEPLSIRQMIDTMIARHAVDPARVFITGLSAGGAMTSVMLATYPDRFAAGAIIAGLPYGTAGNVSEALNRMRNQPRAINGALGKLVANASTNSGPWPRISIWHGGNDFVVSTSNADAVLAQWRELHGVAELPDETELVDGQPHRVWRDDDGRAVIEDYRIAGMAHGTPLNANGPDGCGMAGPHMLEAGISSTRHIARFFGLAGECQGRAEPVRSGKSLPLPAGGDGAAPRAATPMPDWQDSGTAAQVIERALRSAGLMR